MNRFYVYAHIRKDNGEVFYVGKGEGKRARVKVGRNSYWNRISKKYGYKVLILKNKLSSEEAFNLEISCIRIYKSIGMCKANLCEGGLGGIPALNTIFGTDII